MDGVLNFFSGIIGGIIGAVIGAIATYLIIRTTQKRSWKREDVKDIYAPLFSEIISIRSLCEKLAIIREKKQEWIRIRHKEHLFWLIPKDLRQNIEKFYEIELKEYERIRDKSIRKIINILSEFLRPHEAKKGSTGKWDKEIIDEWKSYEIDKRNFLDYSSGIAKFILSENSGDSFLNQKFEGIKEFLGLNFNLLEDFHYHFLVEFKKSKEHREIHEKKDEILMKIDEILKGLKQKMDVE